MNISFKNISKKKRRFFSDLYTTLLDASWTFSVIMFFTSFYGSWLFFGAVYFIICYLHGDFMEENLISGGKDWIPCILQVDGFASSFLFSLETQHTIGYGSRQTTTECPLAMLVVSIQVRGVSFSNNTLFFHRLLLVASFKHSWLAWFSQSYLDHETEEEPSYSAIRQLSLREMGGSVWLWGSEIWGMTILFLGQR